jgi:hypothetical protein
MYGSLSSRQPDQLSFRCWSKHRNVSSNVVHFCGDLIEFSATQQACRNFPFYGTQHNNKTTRVWRGVSRPSRVCFCSLRNHTSVASIFIQCHKYYQKTTFNSGIPHAKFATTLCRWSHDITSTCPTCHWGFMMTLSPTEQRKSVYHICFIPPRIDHWTPRVIFCYFFTKYITLVLGHAVG